MRTLADNKIGYYWENGLIFLTSLDDDDSPKLVVPQSKRKKLIEIAHNKSEHVGSRKTRELLNSRFTWLGLGKDVLKFTLVIRA